MRKLALLAAGAATVDQIAYIRGDVDYEWTLLGTMWAIMIIMLVKLYE